ncbi:MAG: ankyrin repeat domain-containing protein [Syntrophales bacterium]
MNHRQAYTYEEIKPLVALCKAGRLFEVQKWISAGFPLVPPPPEKKKPRKQSPLQIAMENGFHSLVEVLLQAGVPVEEPRYSALEHALRKRRLDLIELLVSHGADVHSVPMLDVFDTWNNDIVEFFITKGADPETGYPLAGALCSRIRTALAIFKRHQDRFPSFPEQVNMALRHHCKEGNLKWVSLMLWAGGDPYVKGPCWFLDGKYDDDHYSAMELAVIHGHYDVFKLKGIRLDPGYPDAHELLRDACYGDNSNQLKMLLERGFDPGSLDRNASSVVESLVWSMARDFNTWSPSQKQKDIDSYRSREKMKMLHMLVRHGARWEPQERRSINDVRRSLMRMKPDYILEFIWIMTEYNACSREAVHEIMKHPSARSMVSRQVGRLNSLLEHFGQSPLEASLKG